MATALSDLGHDPHTVEVGPHLLATLETTRPDVVFNIATGYHTKKCQAKVAAMLELSGTPFTGSDSTAHIIGLQKHISKLVFNAHGIPTPDFYVIKDSHGSLGSDHLFENPDRLFEVFGKEESTGGLAKPVIVKPATEGSSVGIFPESVTRDPAYALSLTAGLLESHDPPVLIEEFIAGREFTVAVIGYPEPYALPVEEIVFHQGETYTYDVKTRDSVKPMCPARISDRLSREIQGLAVNTFKSIGCRDMGRVDIRLSENEEPLVLEINTMPGLMPNYSEVPRIARAAGIGFTELVDTILKGALRRKSREHYHHSEGCR